MADFLNQFNATVDPFLEPLGGPYVRPLLILFLSVYAGIAAPLLPKSFITQASTVYGRVLWLALIVYLANKDPTVSIVAALAFVVTLNVSAGKGFIEGFEGPATAIVPGCLNLKVADLLESFNGDKNALLKAMLVSKVPENLTVDDGSAPLIATYLLNRGFILKDPCSFPK